MANKIKFIRENFVKTFQKKDYPDNIEKISISKSVINENGFVDILMMLGWENSKSELRRLIIQGGLKVNSKKCSIDTKLNFSTGDIVQLGKRKFIQINIIE